jgi:3-hydroxymyristoyl/3-hydroxydecanoyl-(acyl carrier protein) dehydratase
MRYLLIDHIKEWKQDTFIKGVKNIAMSEDFLEFHFPRNPIMPGVLLLESLTQLAGWLEAISSDFTQWLLVKKVRKCSFYGFALPGDQVELEVRLISDDKQGVKVFSGIGMVNGRKKIVAEFETNTIPFNEIEEPDEQKRFFQVLTRKGENLEL